MLAEGGPLVVDTGRIGFVSSNSFDVIGAAAYGFRTIWVNRTAAPLDQLGQPPHLTVADLAELVDARVEYDAGSGTATTSWAATSWSTSRCRRGSSR